MTKEMAWLPVAGVDGTRILHIKDRFGTWRPYTAFPHLSAPDYPIPGGSKGWATYQKLRASGYALVATTEAVEARS